MQRLGISEGFIIGLGNLKTLVTQMPSMYDEVQNQVGLSHT